MKILYIFFFLLFIGFKSFSQESDYDIWYYKMKNNTYLLEIFKVSENLRVKLANGYYGDDLKLLKKLDPKCYKSEILLKDCLKSVGFKKSADFSHSIFERIKLFSMFIKENPDFYKLDVELRKKLLKKFAIDNFIPNLPI